MSISNIKNYINDNYNIVNISNNTDLEDCHTFLLMEDHYDETARQTNGFFISQFAIAGSILLTEGEDMLKPSPLKSVTFKQLHINTPHIEHVMGWDMEDYSWHIEAPSIAQQCAILVDQRKDPSTNWKGDMRSLFEANKKGDWEEIQITVPERVENIYKRIDLVAESISEFEKNEVHPYEIQCYRTVLAAENETDVSKKTELMGKTIELYNQVFYRRELRTSLILGYGSSDELFPKRTESMIKTLKIVHSMILPKIFTSQSYCFLVGGENHLMESVRDLNDPKKAGLYSLQPLREYLKNQTGIVILKPKCLS